MIDRRELLEQARLRNLNLQIIEKDYVLGWLLFGFSKFDSLFFKGGTALSKVYFPQTWRLSEDLDFAFEGKDFERITGAMETLFNELKATSGITFEIKSQFSNPEYLQLKVRYNAVLGNNWAKIDVTKEKILSEAQNKKLFKIYSDYPDFMIKVESLEEIFAQKLRAILERTKSRDYYDVFRLCVTDFDKKKLKTLFEMKCKLKGIVFSGLENMIPKDAFNIIKPYWEKGLGRLVNPLPDLNEVLADLQVGLGFLRL